MSDENMDNTPVGSAKLADMDVLDNRDGYVYYVDPIKQQCPKCGMIGSIMRNACGSCGALVILNREMAGKKEKAEIALQKIKANTMGKKKTQTQKKPTDVEEEKKEVSQDNVAEEIENQAEDEEDFHIKEPQNVSQEELAIQLLKKAKSLLKENEELLSEHFVEVKITFAPFNMEVIRKSKPLKI